VHSGGSPSIFWASPITLTLIAGSFLLLVWNVLKVLRGDKAVSAGMDT
jgi:hypothetical protein